MKINRFKKCIITICCLFVLAKTVEGQVVRKITKKIGQKTANESNQLFKNDQDKKIKSNSFEKIFSSDGDFDMTSILNNNADFQVPDSYKFDFQVTMEMKMDKERAMTQVWKYNLAEGYFGFEISDMLMIYELEGDQMVNINRREKTYSAISTSMMGMFGQHAEDEKESFPIMVKTNETKTILGYTATKYIMEDDTMKGEFWMAPEVEFDQAAFARSIGANSKNAVPLPEQMQGFMMEMTALDKKSRTTSILKVLQLGEIKEVINMSNYKNGMVF